MKARAVLVVRIVVAARVVVVVIQMVRVAGCLSFPLAGRYFHGRLPNKQE